MNPMTPLLIVLTGLAVARVTRLLTRDRILDAPRDRILLRLDARGLLAYLIVCDWCTSIYVGAAAAVTGAALDWWPWTWAPILALAYSQVTGWFASREGDV